MKTKNNSDIIFALTSLVLYFEQHGYDTKFIHSDHEIALISATSFLNRPYNIKQLPHISMNKNYSDMFTQ